jgi:hypothetical protein
VSNFRELKSDFSGQRQPDDIYGREIENLLLQLTGADKAITFGIVVRQTEPLGPNFQPPASDVHVDWTPRRAHNLARELVSKSDEPDFRYTRFIAVNLWRAISPGPQDYPLAVCDARSLSSCSTTANVMIGVDKIPDLSRTRELLPDGPILSEADLFTYDDGQKWYYYSDLQDDEIMVFKLYDSENEKTGRCPHAAFKNDKENAKPRESVEIRSIVYFK